MADTLRAPEIGKPLASESENRYDVGMDWEQLIAELVARPMSQAQIAAACGCGQATIADLANGKTKEPRHSLGEALRALHASTSAKSNKEAA